MLSEKYVQRKALNYLKRRYRIRARSRIFAKQEVSTLPKYGRKRADGLIIFKHWIWGAYVISMEAKSQKTLAAIRPIPAKTILYQQSLKVGFFLLLLSGSLMTVYKLDDAFFQFLIPLSIFITGSWVYRLLTQNSYHHQKAPVFKQLGQYPANEQWLAVPKDALLALPKNKRKALYAICRRLGVGLVVVNKIGLVYTKIRPRKKKRLAKFKKYYALKK